jgi:predicted DNA-binding ribbon-helix-helix protein
MKNQEIGLISRNVTINGKRTSVRMEEQMWRALQSITKREQCSIHDLCSLVVNSKKKAISMTASLRIFIMMYFKAAATEEGHRRAGHGDFQRMRARAQGFQKNHKRKLYMLDQKLTIESAQAQHIIPHYKRDMPIQASHETGQQSSS